MASIKLIYPAVSSKIWAELLRSFFEGNFSSQCQITDKISKIEANLEDSFIICESVNFLQGHMTDTHGEELIDFQNPICSYILLNFPRGEENRLCSKPVSNQIKGLFYSDDSQEIIHKGIQAILRGEIWVPRNVLASILNGSKSHRQTDKSGLLSVREASILRLVMDGRTNKDISQELYISSNTVKVHIYNIYKKIKVNNRWQASIWAANNIR